MKPRPKKNIQRMKDKSFKMRKQNNSSNKNGTFYDPKAINEKKNHFNKKEKQEKSSAIDVPKL